MEISRKTTQKPFFSIVGRMGGKTKNLKHAIIAGLLLKNILCSFASFVDKFFCTITDFPGLCASSVLMRMDFLIVCPMGHGKFHHEGSQRDAQVRGSARKKSKTGKIRARDQR